MNRWLTVRVFFRRGASVHTKSMLKELHVVWKLRSMRRLTMVFNLLTALALSIALSNRAEAGPEKRPPNIVFMLADDVGYDDIGCYGAKKIKTPNVDKLAKQGMRFTSYYAPHAVCTPTRAALMTGCYAQRVGLPAVLYPQDNIGLNDSELTLAEMLKESGYSTAIIGKWHLGHLPQFLPTRHGFDYWFGLPYPNDHGPERSKRKNPPIPLFRNEKVIEQPVNLHTLNDRFVDEAKKFLNENKDKPFFLYLPFVDAHTPWFVDKRFEGKSGIGPYGDAVQAMDWAVGEVLKTLDKLGLDDNTIVVFASDNGPLYKPHPELEQVYGPAGKLLPQEHLLRGGKYTSWEGGVRVPLVVRWPGKTPKGSKCDEIAAGFDFYPTFAKAMGASLPTDRIIDGKNILPLITGEKGAKTPHETFFYFANYGLEAVRSGKWKLRLVVEDADGKAQTGIALYDLEHDVRELTDVAAKHPEIVARLQKLAENCREDIGDARQKREGKNRRPPGKA
jgi:arylsulfatase A